VCDFGEVFMLYVEGEIWIKDPEHGGIPSNLIRPQEKLCDGQCHKIKQIIDLRIGLQR